MSFLDYFTDEAMLYGGRYSPVLDYLGFVHLPAKQVAELIYYYHNVRKYFYGRKYFSKSKMIPIKGELKENLLLLEPFDGDIVRRYVVTQTVNPQWSMIIGNDAPRGGGAQEIVNRLARISKCEGLSVHMVRPVENPETGYGCLAACGFEYYPPNTRVTVDAPCFASVQSDHQKPWVFHILHSKEYFDFEDIEGYKATVITDRFNPVKAIRYCKYFGLDPFNEHFYTHEAYVIKGRRRTKNKPLFELSLAQMRERLGYHLLDTP
ncbi:MAG: hypothetical protein Q4P72_06405 [Eubacteriales bacterium]|nr:hypothetical protein [Eubacteriales bacterium]